METAVLCERGQITIPKRFRMRLGLHPRTRLVIRISGDALVLSKPKSESANPFEAARGIIKTDRRTDDIVRELRGC